MSRKRQIRPDFAACERIGRVSREARLFFILLWTAVDDAGRAHASPRLLASALYPFDDDATSRVGEWLSELANEGLVTLYTVDGLALVQVEKWSSLQVINRPTPSKLTPPQVGSASGDCTEGLQKFSESSVSTHGVLSESSLKPGGSPDGNPPKIFSASRLYINNSYFVRERSALQSEQELGEQVNEPSPHQPAEPMGGIPPKGAAAASIWGAPVNYLTAHGVPERHARGVIGRWLKGRDPQTVIDAITTAQLNAAVDPISFVTKILSAGGSSGRIQGQHGRAGQSKHDAMAELKRFQAELAERERGGGDGDAEIIDIGDYAAR